MFNHLSLQILSQYFLECSVTLNEVSGTFQSPSNSDTQYCSWTIMVNTTQYIHLTINYFREQHESGSNELYVFNGESATGEVLGLFNGTHPPPEEGIYSSSNRIFVVFKSDKIGAKTGFNASYYGVNTTVMTGECSRGVWGGGEGTPYKGLIGTCDQSRYSFRDFCLKQGI